MRVAFVLTSSRSTAEEIVQDAFVRLQTTRTRVLNPAAYLRTVVANGCRDAHRHQAVVDRNPMPAQEPSMAEHDELFDALARLPWRQQAALVLRFHVDLAESDIAAALAQNHRLASQGAGEAVPPHTGNLRREGFGGRAAHRSRSRQCGSALASTGWGSIKCVGALCALVLEPSLEHENVP